MSRPITAAEQDILNRLPQSQDPTCPWPKVILFTPEEIAEKARVEAEQVKAAAKVATKGSALFDVE